MKKEELMIGDWVSVLGIPMRIAELGIVRAGLLDEKEEMSRAGLLDENEEMSYNSYAIIEPIPLTTEILKKNKYDYNDSLHEWATDSFCIEFGHVLSNEEQPDHFFIWVSDCEVELKYVHELQHARRLCGIEKEIDI